MRVCKKCGCNHFYAHQIVRMDIICNGDGSFQSNVHEDNIATDIYDAERPYGPFSCMECGEEYDKLEHLIDITPMTQEDILKGLKLGVVGLADHPDGRGVVCEIGTTWFYFSTEETNADLCHITAQKYRKKFSLEQIAGDIFPSFDELKDNGNWDEYLYYTLFLRGYLGVKEVK